MGAAGVPLSLNQEFLCGFDLGDERGAFSHRHTVVFGWRVAGRIDTGVLQLALDDVVERHEALRTTVVRDGTPRHQRVDPPVPVSLAVRELPAGGDRDAAAEEFLNECDAATYPVSQLPHLRAVLGRFDDQEAVLVLAVHHTATDAWSMQLLIRDVAICYAQRVGAEHPPLPHREQYTDFASWQREQAGGKAVAGSLAYWREKLAAARITGVPGDRPATPDMGSDYAAHRFVVDAGLTGGVLGLAGSLRATPFMVLLAVYSLLLRTRAGTDDIVVPTLTSGRYEERFQESVGVYFNFLPLRTDLAGSANFREVVERTRTTCLEAYTHDTPFPLIAGGSPDLVAPFGDPEQAVIAFELQQVATSMDSEQIGDLRYTELRRRVRSQQVSSDIPNGVLWSNDIVPSGEMVGSIKYNRNTFDQATIADLAGDFGLLLGMLLMAPDAPLG